MNKTIQLPPRLRAVSNMVREGVTVADVGTDHAFLPVYLLLNGKISGAIACDINIGPLQNARENVIKYGVSDRIKLVLCNGLQKVGPDEADDIVIAGMGGELIAQIIDSTPWLCSENKHIIMQPMTRANLLRKYLCENGFEILKETVASEGDRVYSVLLARFLGDNIHYDDLFLYTGKINPKDGKDSVMYLERQARILREAANGISKGGAESEKAEQYLEISQRIEQMLESE